MPLKKNSNKHHEYPHIEDAIEFTLHKLGHSFSSSGDAKYAASLKHNARDIGDARDEYIVERYLSGKPIKTAVAEASGIIHAMAELVMRDGISRRLGDMFEMRLEIKGSFDRPDESFSPYRHRLQLKLIPLNGINRYSRQTPPVNTQKKPRGRIESVSFEGGDIGKIKFGQDIIIRGKDLKFLRGDYLCLIYTNKQGEEIRRYCMFDPDQNPFLVNTETCLRVKWFGPKSFGEVKNASLTLLVNPWHPNHSNPTKRGASAALTLLP